MKMEFKLLTLAALFSAGTLLSCSESAENKMEDSADSLAAKVEGGMDQMGNKVDSFLNRNADEKFLSDAIEANTMEIKSLQLGQQKGGSSVKSSATHMLGDHKKLAANVEDYIKKKNIVVNDVDTTNNSDLADKQAGNDFDKAWADKMVNDHQKVIDMFEDYEDDVQDAELKNLITNTLPTLRSHLEMSKQLQNKLNNNR